MPHFLSHLRLVLIACTAVLFASCTVVEYQETEKIDAADPELARSIELGGGILTAFRDGDYNLLVKNIPGPLKTKMTEKDFKTSCKNYRDTLGKIKDFNYELELKTPAVRNLVWSVNFERENSDGDPVEQGMLFRLVTGNLDDEVSVLSCGFL